MARRSGKGGLRKPGVTGAESEEILWAKYLDYCSAQISDLFMGLEEERVFELARVAEKDAGIAQGALSFRDIAALLVGKLVDDLSMPDFESWAESYRQNPEEYDPHLLGLWKTRIKTPAAS